MDDDFTLNHDYFDTLPMEDPIDLAFEVNIDLLDEIDRELAEVSDEN